MHSPTLCAVVVNYNSGEDLRRAVRSLYTSKMPIEHIVIVDNASRDGSLEACKKEFSRAHCICNTKNIGFAAAANSGIRFGLERGAQWVLLLNPDAYIAPQTISALVQEAGAHKEYGILAPSILSPQTDAVWFSGGEINWKQFRALHSVAHGQEKLFPTTFASGCVMLISADTFSQNGLFDERFFLYYEDADFCLRASKKGIKTGVVPHAQAWHYEKSEENKPQKTYWLVRSGLLFFDQHVSWWLRPWYITHYLLRRVKNGAQRIYDKKNPEVQAVAHAYRDHAYEKKHPQHENTHNTTA